MRGQGSLPDPPEGFTWQSQGVMVYTDSDAFTVDLGHNNIPGALSETVLDQTLSLATYDAAPFVNQHVVVHSSSYSVSLDGLGSVVVVNLDGAPATFSGDTSFNNWVLGEDATTLPASDQISNSAFPLDPGSGGLFDNGAGKSSLFVSRAASGSAPTDGSTMNFDFDGTYRVDLNATTLNGLWFASGSARGNAQIQTVYERFDLVPVPEPSVLVLLLGGAALALRRRRA